jgi:hypothetical protein
MSVDAAGVRSWFGEYLDAFAACARGEREIRALLGYYGVPLIVTSDDGVVVVTTDDDVVAAVEGQLDALRAAGFHHSDVLHSDLVPLNATSALYRGTFSRRHRDGGEIQAVTVTYVVTEGAAGLRISVLAAHGD